MNERKELRENTNQSSVDTGDELTSSESTLADLLAELDAILAAGRERENQSDAQVREAHPEFQKSARNLLHYLALRNQDIRPLQERLAQMGLSSLGRTEAHVQASLTAVRNVLAHLDGRRAVLDDPPLGFEGGAELLVRHTEALFGPAHPARSVRIMVTLPSEAADDYSMVRDMIAEGMECARINCAHDHPDAWIQMAENVRRAADETGRLCRVLMDLNGPKLRTGPLEPGPRVIRWKPHRDARGRVTAPARIWLATDRTPVLGRADVDAVLPLDEEWLCRLKRGDRIQFRDARRKKRSLYILETHSSGCLALSYKTAYVETGNKLKLRQSSSNTGDDDTFVGELPISESHILLRRGETLVVQRRLAPGAPAERANDGSVVTPARVSCTLPQVFADVQPGDIVKLDDGKIEGIARAVSENEIHVEITHAKEQGTKLRGDKSINFPHTPLRIRGLTPKDLEDLDVAVRHADIIGLSFVNDAQDVVDMNDALAERGAENLGIILKIETKRGFERMPDILLAAMRRYPAGVMIARGDLAVEIGWERLAEVQEEMLWLCEAAHVPVIWATQVLETLAKKGRPSRAEITDAAMAERAECVMLNKGPHLLRAIQTLDDIMKRMQPHQQKKMSMLRSLLVARQS